MEIALRRGGCTSKLTDPPLPQRVAHAHGGSAPPPSVDGAWPWGGRDPSLAVCHLVVRGSGARCTDAIRIKICKPTSFVKCILQKAKSKLRKAKSKLRIAKSKLQIVEIEASHSEIEASKIKLEYEN
jgi:hypothetical protein